MNWPAYEDYIDSDIDWLDKIPSHWETKPLRSMFSRIKNTGFPNEPMLSVYRDYGVIHKDSRDDNGNKTAEDRNIYQLVDTGWLVTNRMKAWQGSVGISRYRGIVSGHYICFRPTHSEDDAYLNWLLRSPQYIAGYKLLSRGVRPGQAEIDNDQYKTMPIIIPPINEQINIARFLDHETSKIDALISKQEKLIATLREDRITIITNAVTKGLDPNVKMKDSGAKWIGAVPSHWTVSKVKYGFSVTLGKMYQSEAASEEDSQLPHLKAGSITDSGIDTKDPMMCWFSPREIDSLSLKAGDVLVVEGGAIGRCTVLKKNLDGWGFQKSLNRVRALRNDSPDFLAYLLNAATASGHVSVLCGKSTIPHFTAEKLEALEWPHPTEKEQLEIANFLAAKCAQIDSLINKATDIVKTVREYRAALISATVSGKINVSEDA